MNPDRLRDSLSALSSDLRSRRLLAVVCLLVVVAIAIPLLLSRSGKATAVAALPPAPSATIPDLTSAPVATAQHRKPSHDYLAGPAHNPFASTTSTSAPATSTRAAGITTATTASGSAGTPSDAAVPSAVGSAGSASQSASATGTTTAQHTTSSASSPGVMTPPTITVTTPALTTTVIKTVTKAPPFADFEARMSIRQDGMTSGSKVFSRLSRYQLLPADSGAFASFLGIRTDKKTAVLLLADGVELSGQGRCAPSTLKCSFLTLQPGQSVRLSTPAWAGSKTFTLHYQGVSVVTSSASIVNVDERGRTVIRAAGADDAGLAKMTYGDHTGLLTIGLGPTVPVSR